MVIGFAIAFGHHPEPSSQIAVGSPLMRGGGTVSLGVSHDWTRFADLYEGSRQVESVDRFGVHTTTAAVDVRPGPGVFRLSLPIATVDGVTGLGDLLVQGGIRSGPWSFEGGMSAPTGRSSEVGAVSFTEVDVSDGELLVRDKDARVLPGLGAWAMTLGGHLREVRGPHRWTTSVVARVPLHETDDGIRWGTDLLVVGRFERRVGATWFGADVTHTTHLPDRLRAPDGSTERANRRHEMVVGPAASVAVGPLVMGVRARVPVWRWVQGTQLVSGLGGTLQVALVR